MGTPPQYGYRGLSSLGKKVSPKADAAQGVSLRVPEVNSNSFAPVAARDVDDYMLCHGTMLLMLFHGRLRALKEFGSRSVLRTCRLITSASCAMKKVGFGTNIFSIRQPHHRRHLFSSTFVIHTSMFTSYLKCADFTAYFESDGKLIKDRTFGF